MEASTTGIGLDYCCLSTSSKFLLLIKLYLQKQGRENTEM